jgi:hypothetical protein
MLHNFEHLAQNVWSAPVDSKVEQIYIMINETVSSLGKKQAMKNQVSNMRPGKIDQFAANLMLFNGDTVLK